MNHFVRSWIVLLVAVMTGLFSCSADKPKPGADKPVLTVSILPQAFVVKRIAGEDFEVNTLVGEGQSPHSYEPSPAQIAALAKSIVWFRIGVDFENGFAPKVAAAYPALRTVKVTEGMVYRMIEGHVHEDVAGGHDVDRDHLENATGQVDDTSDSPDMHVWLSSVNLVIMAGIVRDTLAGLYPDKAILFKQNHDALVSDTRKTYDKLKTDLAPLMGQTVYVFHPAFGYLLDELGIKQEAVETGGKEPSPKAIATLIEHAKKDGVKTIFVQSQFPVTAATTIAESIGGKVLSLDPLAENLLDNVQLIGTTLRHGFAN